MTCRCLTPISASSSLGRFPSVCVCLSHRLLKRTPQSRLPGGSDCKESSCNAGDSSSIPGFRKSPGKGNGYPCQYSYLGNSKHRGAWQVTSVPFGVAKSWTRLTNTFPFTGVLGGDKFGEISWEIANDDCYSTQISWKPKMLFNSV